MRELAARSEKVREEERARISREIHDVLGQLLTSLKLDVRWVSRQLSHGADEHALKPVRARLDRMAQHLDTTTQTVRKIATELRPVILEDLGLIPAIEWQAKDFELHTLLQCRLVLFVRQAMLDKEQSTAMFRIFQEILTNIARHANATAVTVSLTEQSGMLILEVKDNGRGITEGEIAGLKSLGVVGMRERAHQAGGDVAISGSSGEGTTVRVWMPMNQESEERRVGRSPHWPASKKKQDTEEDAVNG
jgi:signal transduction histidine kinase